MGVLVAGVGDFVVSKTQGDVLKTFALGSCVGVMIYDKLQKIGGLIHIALPDSNVDLEKARLQPAYFADTGLPRMIEEMKKLGANKSNIWIKIAGGSNIMDPNGVFDIGKRNAIAVKKVLWKSAMGPIAEDIGGNISRTVLFELDSGKITLSCAGKTWEL